MVLETPTNVISEIHAKWGWRQVLLSATGVNVVGPIGTVTVPFPVTNNLNFPKKAQGAPSRQTAKINFVHNYTWLNITNRHCHE